MAQQQVTGLAALACYTVDSDEESEDGENAEYEGFGDLRVKQEVVDPSDDPTENQTETWRIDVEGHRDPTEDISVGAGDFLQPQDIKTEIESESEDSSSDSDSDSSDSDDDDINPQSKAIAESEDKTEEFSGPPKTTNELLTKDLPPVENITARVSAAECTVVGHIKNIVEDLVVVESVPGLPALDLDTVLFVEQGEVALGRVFDVIGPVTRPLYVVRFNSAEHVAERGITREMKVYFAPKSEFTSYVFLEQLMRMKISDASWVNDEEPPPQFQEFSDDEEEQRAKKEIKLRKKSQVSGEATEAKRSRQTDTSNPRHCNQRYTPATNPFYRTSRTYHPGQPGGGGIQWSQYNVASQYGQPQPQHGGYYPGTAWPPQYNQYQQLAANINYHHHNNQQQQQLFPNLNLPPPPPPPPGTD